MNVVTSAVRRPLLVLLGAVGFVVLIACVNLAGLQLARAAGRGREIGVRMALGARRGRLVRQLLTESFVLAVCGGLVGLAVAVGLTSGLLALAAGELPRVSEVRLDAAVLAFSLLLSVLTGLLFGLIPAWRTSSLNVHHMLREGGRGAVGADSGRLRTGLIVAEVALAVILVVGAGLMGRSFIALLDVDPGFQPDKLIAVQFTINPQRYPSPPPPPRSPRRTRAASRPSAVHALLHTGDRESAHASRRRVRGGREGPAVSRQRRAQRIRDSRTSRPRGAGRAQRHHHSRERRLLQDDRRANRRRTRVHAAGSLRRAVRRRRERSVRAAVLSGPARGGSEDSSWRDPGRDRRRRQRHSTGGDGRAGAADHVHPQLAELAREDNDRRAHAGRSAGDGRERFARPCGRSIRSSRSRLFSRSTSL